MRFFVTFCNYVLFMYKARKKTKTDLKKEGRRI